MSVSYTHLDFEVLEERLPIADPYVLFYEDCYYAYGTNVRGFEVYTSTDLKHAPPFCQYKKLRTHFFCRFFAAQRKNAPAALTSGPRKQRVLAAGAFIFYDRACGGQKPPLLAHSAG